MLATNKCEDVIAVISAGHWMSLWSVLQVATFSVCPSTVFLYLSSSCLEVRGWLLCTVSTRLPYPLVYGWGFGQCEALARAWRMQVERCWDVYCPILPCQSVFVRGWIPLQKIMAPGRETFFYRNNCLLGLQAVGGNGFSLLIYPRCFTSLVGFF